MTKGEKTLKRHEPPDDAVEVHDSHQKKKKRSLKFDQASNGEDADTSMSVADSTEKKHKHERAKLKKDISSLEAAVPLHPQESADADGECADKKSRSEMSFSEIMKNVADARARRTYAKTTPTKSKSEPEYVGVNLHPHSGMYEARITLDGNQEFLGAFPTAELAAIAYDARSIQARGPLARRNFDDDGNIQATHSSKYRGVSLDKKRGFYKAYIKVDKKMVHLGVFENETEAAKAYDKAARTHQGERAKLNFPKLKSLQ